MKLNKEEKLEKAVMWIENAIYNIDNMKRTGLPLDSMIKDQLENAIKAINDEDISGVL